MTAYPDAGDSLVAAAQASDVAHGVGLASPLLNNPPSRISTPTPAGGYYTTLGAPTNDQSHSARGGVEPLFRHSIPNHHPSATPEPHSPNASRMMTSAPYGPTLKVIQWTPQHGDEGTRVTIILASLAINAAAPTQYSIAAFEPGSPAQLSQPTAVTRRFVVVFGSAVAPTKFNRAHTIESNGTGQTLSAGSDEADAFVVLTTFVPARQSMGPIGERIMVLVQVVDESSAVLEECIVGEWDAMPVHRGFSSFSRVSRAKAGLTFLALGRNSGYATTPRSS
jgi:hypothetical protein